MTQILFIIYLVVSLAMGLYMLRKDKDNQDLDLSQRIMSALLMFVFWPFLFIIFGYHTIKSELKKGDL